MNDNKNLIEEAAKVLTGLTDAEWEIATAEGTDHLTGYFEAAERVWAVFEKAHTPTDDWDADKHADAEGIFGKRVTPTDDERKALGKLIDEIDADWLMGEARPPYPNEMAEELIRRGVGFRRTEVPEPSADVEMLGEWFMSTYGVAVAAVAPMTDRGPSVMVDGRVISPNDVAALVEFRAQGEPSDALRDAIDHIQGAVEFQDAINPEAVRVVIDAALRVAAVTAPGVKNR